MYSRIVVSSKSRCTFIISSCGSSPQEGATFTPYVTRETDVEAVEERGKRREMEEERVRRRKDEKG